MPHYSLSEADLVRTCEIVQREGSGRRGAKFLNLRQSTIVARMQEAVKRGIWDAKTKTILRRPPPVDRIAELEAALKHATRPIYSVRHDTATTTKMRGVVIGDAHDSPQLPKDRFEWIGDYIDRVRPDFVVQIGDFGTFDSLNGHIPNQSYDGKSKPTFMADITSFRDALDAIGSRLSSRPEMHCTLGNHERRLWIFEQNAPEAYGMMQKELDLAFRDRGWTYSPYGQIQMYGGVGFVHAALNRLGKTYGGKNIEATIANESIFDLLIGHSHVERSYRAPKIGAGNFIQVINTGCALPQGHIEKYAEHALTGWAWGIMDVTIKDGHVIDRNFISMDTLEETRRK
jgi:hypothetical protein